MGVRVIVPLQLVDESRQAAWGWVARAFGAEGRNVYIGTPDTDEWVKATAARFAIDALPDDPDEVLVIHDADVWCEGLQAAVDAVQSGSYRWAIPHRTVYRLSRSATNELLVGGSPAIPGMSGLDRAPYLGHPGGGIVVIRRGDYNQVPLDPRFVGWGQEDDSWAVALRTMFGRPWRGSAPLFHLWHEPQERQSATIGSPASLALWERYRAASGSQPKMRALVAEIKGVPLTDG